jgi:hypothetical protein
VALKLRHSASTLTCFVIGPIGDKDAEVDAPERRAYEEAAQVMEEIIEPSCVGYGIQVLRADQIQTTGEIPEQVFRHLRDAYLVIADLTGANPNVLYELGMRHTTGKLTIQIGERGRLPFDVSIIRTILFKRTPAGLVEARRRLSAMIGAGIEHGGDPVTATRVWFESTAAVDVEIEPDQLGSTDENAPGFLEKIADMSEALDSANISLAAIPEVMGQITERVNVATTRLAKANASGAPASARLSITNELARELEEPASRLSVLVGDYSLSVERMSPGIIYVLTVAREQPSNQEATEFASKVRNMLVAAEESFPAVEGFRRSALESGEASRLLRRVNRHIASSLEQILSAKRIFDSWRTLL